MDLSEFHSPSSVISALDNRGVHNFAFAPLDLYFHLSELLDSRAAFFLWDTILVLQGRNPKTFVFDAPNVKDLDLRGDVVEYLRQQGPLYSLEKHDWLGAGVSGFHEISYTFEDVFDKKNYANAKKRHQRLVYPFKWLEKRDIQIRPLDPSDLPAVESLHKDWVAHKMADEKVYKIMFPTGRYINCVRQILRLQQPKKKGLGLTVSSSKIINSVTSYLLLGAFHKNKLVSVRAAGVQDWRAYDLAFFTNVWDAESQLSNYLNIAFLAWAKDTGIISWNCGASLNKHLKQFKEHYPSEVVSSFAYSKVKK